MYILTTGIQIQIFKLQFCWPSKTLSTGWSHCGRVCDPAFAWGLHPLFPRGFNPLLPLVHSPSPGHYGKARAWKTVPNFPAPPEGSVSLACAHGAVPSFGTPYLHLGGPQPTEAWSFAEAVTGYILSLRR